MLNRDEIFNLKSKDGKSPFIKSCIIENDRAFKDNYGFFHMDSSFQPGSIDLHVGEIYLPSKKPDEPQKCTKIKPGGTILVRTLEDMNLPLDVGGICFAPARFSLHGLLIVNIGHIDPGYNGKLHFTIVNLGKDPFPLKENDLLATMLLFKYTKIVNYEGMPQTTSITNILPDLAETFMDFENNTKKKIDQAAFTKPVFITVLGFGITIILSLIISLFFQHFSYKDQVDKNYQQLIEQQQKTEMLEDKVDELEKIIQENFILPR